MQQVHSFLTVTNVSDNPCVVNGYAQVALVDAQHHLLPSQNVHGDAKVVGKDPGPTAIVLSPGETGSAGLYWGLACAPGQQLNHGPYHLQITPPGDSTHTKLPFPLSDPTDMWCGRFDITAFARHTPPLA